MPSPKKSGEVRSLACGHYPSFVYSPAPTPPTGREVPVFMFHTIRADEFEEQLQFLAANGYHTPSLDELHLFLAGQKSFSSASVLLTFDDVERGLLTTGVPLLRKYGFRCAAFLAPGRIEDAAQKPRPMSGKAWPSWQEVREMADSGVVDIGSHALTHSSVFVGDSLTGFVHPGVFTDGLGLDNPMVRSAGRDVSLDQLGAPLFPAASRLGEAPRFFDDETVRQECVRFVEAQGGGEFFMNAMWQSRLTEHWRSIASGREMHSRWETAEEQRDAILFEMTESRRILEERISRPVLDFAYPWTIGSSLAIELSREAGYRSNFWGPLGGVRINRFGQDPFLVARIKADYIFRLPGKGRKTLLDILMFKARRRRERHDIY